MRSVEESWFETEDGHRFAARVEGSADATRLIWLGAMGVPARHYDPLAKLLAQRGVQTWAPDWRGLGSSSWRADRRTRWGYPELMADIAQVIARTGPCWIGGHSLGGQFAALSAARNDLPGCALIAAGLPLWRSYGPLTGLALRLAVESAAAITGLLGYYPGRRLGFAGNEAQDVMLQWISVVRSGRYAHALGAEADESLARYRGQALALNFANDAYIPLASTELLLARMGHADTPITVLDGQDLGCAADHFAWMRQPQAVVHRLSRWLAAQRTSCESPGSDRLA